MASNVLDARAGSSDYPDPPANTIAIRGGSLSSNTDDAQQALMDSGSEIYEHGNRLVRVGAYDGKSKHVRRAFGAPLLHEITENWLLDEMTRRIDWVKFDRRSSSWVATNAPRYAAQTLLARSGDWPFPPLAGFIEAPIVLPDGRLIDQPGYDESGFYLVRNGLELQEIPPEPTIDDARNAVNCLIDSIETFPFVEECDIAATLAAMATGVLRRALPAAPLIGITASAPGSGKTLLAHVLSTLATGRAASALSIGKNPDETEKRLHSILLDADPVVLLDNIGFPLTSDVLCIIATEPALSIRLFNTQRKAIAPTNSAFVLTGNNLVLLGDLPRRVLMIRLDADCERPELRPIPRDAIGYIRDRRAELVHAVLVLAKSYLAAGCPDVGAAPYGSFETWDRMVRRAIIWTGLPDPLEGAAELREDDHEFVGFRDLFAVWWSIWGDRPVTAAEIMEKAREPKSFTSPEPAYPDLAGAVAAIVSDGPKSVQQLGHRLRSWTGRIIGPYRLTKSRKVERGVSWFLVRS